MGNVAIKRFIYWKLPQRKFFTTVCVDVGKVSVTGNIKPFVDDVCWTIKIDFISGFDLSCG